MTLPYERTRAVLHVAQFLAPLSDPTATPRVPAPVRRRAAMLLRHYPTVYDVERTAKEARTLWASPDDHR